MLDLIGGLRPRSRVLDIGAGAGSFCTDRDDLTIVRVDLGICATGGKVWHVAADAARLPFASESFDLVISNHSLEHFRELEPALCEIGRVIRRDGALYVAVPDAGTLTDRIYRWMGRGGAHVNAFRSAGQVSGLVERLTGLPHRGTVELFSSLSFLNRHNRAGRPQIKSAIFAFGNERFLAVFTWMLRWLDRRFGGRLSQYGWSCRFGNIEVSQKRKAWINVCVRCGSGFSVAYLGRTRSGWYRCPDCGGANLLFAVRDADRWE